jgi:hypothetical protein
MKMETARATAYAVSKRQQKLSEFSPYKQQHTDRTLQLPKPSDHQNVNNQTTVPSPPHCLAWPKTPLTRLRSRSLPERFLARTSWRCRKNSYVNEYSPLSNRDMTEEA